MAYIELLGFELPLDGWVWCTALVGLCGIGVVALRPGGRRLALLLGVGMFLVGGMGILEGGIDALHAMAARSGDSHTALSAAADRAVNTATVALSSSLAMVLVEVLRRSLLARRKWRPTRALEGDPVSEPLPRASVGTSIDL